MNVALLYAFWEGEPWSSQLSIRQELVSRGHTVYDFNLYHDNGVLHAPGQPRRYSTQGLQRLINAVNHSQIQVDVLLHLDYGVFDSPALDKRYFNNDMLWVLEAGDTPQSFGNTTGKARKFDIIVTPDKASSHLWNQYGINSKWWTHFADHNIFKPYEDEAVQWDIVTTCGGRRVTEKVRNAFGDRYHDGRYAWGEEYGRLLNRGHIVFQCSQFEEITRRVFEGMACGKLVVTDRLPEATHVEDLFVDGEDIVYYSDAEDAINKLRYYIDHPEERERIAANGRKKVMEAHTVSHRIDFLEQEIEAWQRS